MSNAAFLSGLAVYGLLCWSLGWAFDRRARRLMDYHARLDERLRIYDYARTRAYCVRQGSTSEEAVAFAEGLEALARAVLSGEAGRNPPLTNSADLPPTHAPKKWTSE